MNLLPSCSPTGVRCAKIFLDHEGHETKLEYCDEIRAIALAILQLPSRDPNDCRVVGGYETLYSVEDTFCHHFDIQKRIRPKHPRLQQTLLPSFNDDSGEIYGCIQNARQRKKLSKKFLKNILES